MHINSEPTKVLTPAEVTKVFSVSRRTLWAWDAKDILKPIKINRRVVRYRQSDVEALLARN